MRNFTAVTVIFPVIKQMKLRASVTLKKNPHFHLDGGRSSRQIRVIHINLVSYKTSKFEGHQVIAEKHFLQLRFPP